jgi:hypothetical protein
MITPAGTECPYYYEDFHRGRDKKECQLIDRTPAGGVWTPDLCARCPIPRILMANGCPHMILEARVASGIFGINRHVEVSAWCTRSEAEVEQPEIGCGLCHENLPTFSEASEPE